MTTFKTAESPFKANNTASNMCGFTLMNNQVGEVVAQVMEKLPNVTVTWLPSMMRVDGKGRFDVVYADIDEAAGEGQAGSTRRSSRSPCRPTTAGWCTPTIGRSCSPTRRTPPTTWALT